MWNVTRTTVIISSVEADLARINNGRETENVV